MRRLFVAGTAGLAAFAPASAIASAISSVDAPNAWSLAPAAIAIAASLALRQTLPALFFGIAVGAFLLKGAAPDATTSAFADAFAVYIVDAASDRDHMAVMAFSFMIGGMVGILRANGGLSAIGRLLARMASTPRRAQLAAGGLGVAIFFDDYANSMLVGNTMRPVTDRRGVSREKLAYIVDSTSAPVATIALISTWIGYQVSLIGDSVAGVDGLPAPYSLFLHSIAYSFYPMLAIIMVAIIAGTGRDFGPMLSAERRARANAVVPSSADAATGRVLDAALPIAVLIAVGAYGLWRTGVESESVQALLAADGRPNASEIIGAANAYTALLWASLASALAAGVVSVFGGRLGLRACVDAWVDGAASLFLPMLILVLSWAISDVTQALGAANYLISSLGETLPAQLLPIAVFAISAATAFATGSSWGVMAVVMPLAVPFAIKATGADLVVEPGDLNLIAATIASVLGGAVMGDHCSPLSDTTILSSMASGCDLVAHVETQAPYAGLIAIVAVLFALAPSSFGAPPLACLLIGAGALYFFVRIFGRRTE